MSEDDKTVTHDDRMRSVEPATPGSALLLGRYERIRELGRGAHGIVFLYLDHVTSLQVAIKTMPRTWTDSQSDVLDMARNFRMVARLNHPNIAAAKHLERDPESGVYYLVMEYVDGIDLKAVRAARGGRMSLAEIIPYARQIAEGLDYAHRQGIIHRDIKPSNVLVKATGEVKILDFGIAHQWSTHLTHNDAKQTPFGGTLPYMAPEQWRCETQGPGTDQYALCALIYELISGITPFYGHDMTALRLAVLHEKPKPPEGLVQDAWIVLARGLAKDASERHRNCLAVVQAMEKIAANKSTPPGSVLMWCGFTALVVAAASFTMINRGRSEIRQVSEPGSAQAPVEITPIVQVTTTVMVNPEGNLDIPSVTMEPPEFAFFTEGDFTEAEARLAFRIIMADRLLPHLFTNPRIKTHLAQMGIEPFENGGTPISRDTCARIRADILGRPDLAKRLRLMGLTIQDDQELRALIEAESGE